MRDTTDAAELVRLTAVRAMDGASRLRQAIALSEEMRRLALAGLRTRHPDDTEQELVARLVRLQHHAFVDWSTAP